jgi:glucokinase
VFAPNLFWENVPIVRILRRLFNIPVCIAQDTRAAAWAEYLIGAGRGLDSVVSVTLGTGIGCGMVVAGRIYHGALNTAGEFGHQIVELDGHPCNCGRRGCLEAYAGGPAVVRRAKAAIPELGELVHKASDEIDVDDVFSLALNGQPEACRVAGDVVKYVGMGLVNLININSPQLISISGGISNAPRELLLDPLVDFVRSRAYQSAATGVRICRSQVGEDAPLVGAALLYRENAA